MPFCHFFRCWPWSLSRKKRQRELSELSKPPEGGRDPGIALTAAYEPEGVHGDERAFLWKGVDKRPPDDVEDMVQETFTRAYVALKRYPREQVRMLEIRYWLRGIVRHVALDHSVREARRGALSVEMLEEGGVLLKESTLEGPEALLVRREIFNEVSRLINALPKLTRLILALHFIEDRPYSEIALLIDHSEPSVRARVFRATHFIREQMVNR